MRKALVLLCCMGLLETGLKAQRVEKRLNKTADSVRVADLKENIFDDLPVIRLSDNERSENTAFVPGILSAGRDVFMSMADFHFSVTRFRPRGYDADAGTVLVNGMHMNNPDDGNSAWNTWSGLNDVARNIHQTLPLRTDESDFGGTGSITAIDMRASKQRVQTTAGYAFSNRTVTHRWSFTKVKNFNRQGWAYASSLSMRVADEGYFPGTFYRGGSYFIGIDKKIGRQHLLSFVFFGNANSIGKHAAVLEESVELAHTVFYNPYWGYQSGKKRNANVSASHQPVLIITHDWRIDNQTTLITTVGAITGEKTNTAPDWYNAPDPRPDYYRYLPGYQQDPVLRLQVKESIENNQVLQQINWDHLYDVNRHSKELLHDVNGVPAETVEGNHSHYIIEERVAEVKHIELNTVYSTRTGSGLSLHAGISVQVQQTHYFKRINDLLGGDYFVDWNQFAERDFPANTEVIQNDLNHPNHLLHKGDTYGYDYTVTTGKTNGWIQLERSKKRIDYFLAATFACTHYSREGKTKNGLFPFDSFGRSDDNSFVNVSMKGGITYKINGKKYIYLNAAFLCKPPLFDNVFISPRIRNTKQENIVSEKIQTAEAGYVFNSSKIKMRFSGYVTSFKNGMDVMTFFHDGYGNFVNYALSGIDKIHFGTETGIEMKLSNRFTGTLVMAAGRYYYTNRQQVSVTADNNADVLEKTQIYSKNFRIGGTPQEAYGLGLNYQSEKSLYVNLSAHLFRQQWLDFNPLRRTYAALENVVKDSDQWNRIIQQQVLPAQHTLDLSGGGSMRLSLSHSKQAQVLVYNLSVNNLLNQHLVSGGYEQLRFDTDTKDPNKFPPKYYYAMGLNFSVSLSLRL